ncbi:hypothetical protein HDU91_007272 [Kappamyces sp. JEL0680]|nr:hypothetical protein HDU91_007272 [Kappamyces sp. JEL0680]
MGCSCLQVTIQACSIEHARRLYDHLTVMTPIMLALSAAAPIFRGYLVDVDARWKVIAGSVDDRTRQERGLERVIKKSRYETVSRFLSPGPNVSGKQRRANPAAGLCSTTPNFDKSAKGSKYFKEAYNDIDVPMDHDIYQQLMDGGVDEMLAKHYAHLFIRDPLVVFRELLDVDDRRSSDHFENIQSTNWQTMRFKPPTPGSPIGWRVEFRSMDIQLTDHENAAYAVFIVLLAHTISYFDLNFYIPISKVDENMERCQLRNAVLGERFWFRKTVSSAGDVPDHHDVSQEYSSQSIREIMVGDGETTGICTWVDKYLDAQDISESTQQILKAHVNLIRQRATGERMTGATWIRNFVLGHPAYRHDSVVTEEINYDLMQALGSLQSDDMLQ